MKHSGLLYQLDIYTFYSYEPLLFQIFAPFRPFSTITFTVNSHADNDFYKYICFKYFTVLSQFFN